MNSICFGILAFVLVLSAYMFLKYMRIRIVKLTERTNYNSSDLIIGATIPIEFFQYCSLGYNTDTLIGIYVLVAKVMRNDLDKFETIENEFFWLIVYSCYALVALWLVLFSF